ncbi:hypothetical protein KKI24_20740 [bacterium]|nr:hypothetical protein [bacterium]
MVHRVIHGFIIIAGILSVLSLTAVAYEPTTHEIMIQKERLGMFCKLRDNQRKFNICETYKELKGKLPDRLSEIESFRKNAQPPPK